MYLEQIMKILQSGHKTHIKWVFDFQISAMIGFDTLNSFPIVKVILLFDF